MVCKQNLKIHLRDLNRIEIRNYKNNLRLNDRRNVYLSDKNKQSYCPKPSKKCGKKQVHSTRPLQIIINNNTIRSTPPSDQGSETKSRQLWRLGLSKPPIQRKPNRLIRPASQESFSRKPETNSISSETHVAHLGTDIDMAKDQLVRNVSVPAQELYVSQDINAFSDQTSHLYLNLKGNAKPDDFGGFQKIMTIEKEKWGVRNVLSEPIFMEKEKKGRHINMDQDNIIYLKEGTYMVNCSGNFRLMAKSMEKSEAIFGVNLRFDNESDPDTICLVESKQILETTTVNNYESRQEDQHHLVDTDDKYVKSYNFVMNKIIRTYIPKYFVLSVLVKPFKVDEKIESVLIASSKFDLVITHLNSF